MGQGPSKHPVGVLVIGLDNSGKTTAINWLANSKAAAATVREKHDVIVPTTGFTTNRFMLGKTSVTVMDMSGQGRYRNLWTYYLRQCDAIVFVVDSADEDRLPVAQTELHRLLSDPTLTRQRPYVPLLVLANKADRLTSSSDHFRRFADAVRRRCFVTRRPCHVIACSSLNGSGLWRAIDWLLKQVGNRRQLESSSKPTWY